MKISFIYITISLIVVFSTACKKQVAITEESEMTIEIERNEFEDTLYRISRLDVVSTNDTILSQGLLELKDQNGQVIFYDYWKELSDFTFGLPDRKLYELTATLYHNDTVASSSITIDNNDYPDYVKINNIQIDNSVLSTDGTYYISNVHSTKVTIYHALTSYLYEPEDYDVELYTKFYEASFAPKKTSYSFTNLRFPTRSINRKWRFYEIVVSYPIVIGSSGTSVVNDRKITFYLNLENIVKNENQLANVLMYVDSSDSSEGGIYFGTIEFEWVYEN